MIHALLVELEADSTVIVWIDEFGDAPYLRPKRRSQTVLDVRAFQEVLWVGDRREQELVVEAVRLYRCNRPAENGQLVDSGRAWLENGFQSLAFGR